MAWRRQILPALALAALLLPATATAAPQVVTSAAPDAVAITIYRAPDRRHDKPMELDWLEGYALITEKRTVALPAGPTTIRFEGVAGGMLPESALVTGLPTGVREKNLDADLLSPASLYARSFGRPVILRREHPKTGKIAEERAIIRSGPEGSVLLQTRDGFEAAHCGPLNDSLVYPGVPPGLSARPTLSVEVTSPTPARVTLSLSYLAWGFDWQTNYVLHLQNDGEHADMTAWVTASSDPTSFRDADTSVVGGKVNREDERERDDDADHDLVFHCLLNPMPVYGVPAPAPAMAGEFSGDIIVTAQRRSENLFSPVTVVAEGLGDLKLYRVPIATTVASNSVKQVAMFDKPGVKVAVVYTAFISRGVAAPVRMEVRTRNDVKEGLGIALPAGPMMVFEPLNDEPMLIGQSGLRDLAVGEEVSIAGARSAQVHVESQVDGKTVSEEVDVDNDARKPYQVSHRVSNANPWPIDFEGTLYTTEDATLEHPSARLGRKNGQPLWKVRVPANGSATLRYQLRAVRTN